MVKVNKFILFGGTHAKMGEKKAMTLIEILLVTSLIAGTSIAIYQSMANGLKVWNKSLQMGVEENVVIFLDKFSHELRNTYPFSEFGFSGDSQRFSFPTIIYEPALDDSGGTSDEYMGQIGVVEYYYDSFDKRLYKRKAYYGQAVNNEYGENQPVVTSVEKINFQYTYFSENGEIKSGIVLDTIPLGVEISIETMSGLGKRTFRKYVEIPLSG